MNKKETSRGSREAVGITSPREEKEIFADLAALCSSPGFAHAIAYFCCRDNFIRYGNELTAEDIGRLRTGSELIRTEISTLIGLLVRQPIDLALPTPEVMQEYIHRAEALLDELHRALASIWFKDLTPEKVKSGKFDPFSSGSALREPIFYGGDSAYNFQYREFSAKKYAQDKEWLEANKGFNTNTTLSVANAIQKVLTEKQNALRQVLKATDPSQWTALPVLCFSLQEIVERSGLDPIAVENVISEFCFPIKERNAQFTALQEYNATNAMPILSLDNSTYILFQHYSLLEAIYESPFFWMEEDKAYAPTARTHRGAFTESVALERLGKVFGRHVHTNVHMMISKGNELGEIDILVVFGDRAIILQAKSKRLTIEARKGNEAHVKGDFQNAVQSSYDQALECAKALIDGKCKLLDSIGNEIKLLEPIKEVFPICVVSDHYPALAFQARQFLKTEVTDAIKAPLVIDIFALDAITEMLETPLRVLSYLQLRSRFGERLLSTHEFVLLSMHLKCNLWINEKYDFITIEDDVSAHLDAAMIVRREGIPGAHTPDGVLSRMRGTHVGRILNDIENRPDAATIPLGFLLLSLSEDGIDTINKGITRIRSEATLDGKNHDFTGFFGETSSGITIHCNDVPDEEAINSLFNHCELRKYSNKAHTWFGLVLSPKTGVVRFGVTLDREWKQDEQMDAVTQHLRPPMTPKEFRRTLRSKKKVGRNSPCPCGSGQKYKKCCGR